MKILVDFLILVVRMLVKLMNKYQMILGDYKIVDTIQDVNICH